MINKNQFYFVITIYFYYKHNIYPITYKQKFLYYENIHYNAWNMLIIILNN